MIERQRMREKWRPGWVATWIVLFCLCEPTICATGGFTDMLSSGTKNHVEGMEKATIQAIFFCMSVFLCIIATNSIFRLASRHPCVGPHATSGLRKSNFQLDLNNADDMQSFQFNSLVPVLMTFGPKPWNQQSAEGSSVDDDQDEQAGEVMEFEENEPEDDEDGENVGEDDEQDDEEDGVGGTQGVKSTVRPKSGGSDISNEVANSAVFIRPYTSFNRNQRGNIAFIIEGSYDPLYRPARAQEGGLLVAYECNQFSDAMPSNIELIDELAQYPQKGFEAYWKQRQQFFPKLSVSLSALNVKETWMWCLDRPQNADEVGWEEDMAYIAPSSTCSRGWDPSEHLSSSSRFTTWWKKWESKYRVSSEAASSEDRQTMITPTDEGRKTLKISNDRTLRSMCLAVAVFLTITVALVVYSYVLKPLQNGIYDNGNALVNTGIFRYLYAEVIPDKVLTFLFLPSAYALFVTITLSVYIVLEKIIVNGIVKRAALVSRNMIASLLKLILVMVAVVAPVDLIGKATRMDDGYEKALRHSELFAKTIGFFLSITYFVDAMIRLLHREFNMRMNPLLSSYLAECILGFVGLLEAVSGLIEVVRANSGLGPGCKLKYLQATIKAAVNTTLAGAAKLDLSCSASMPRATVTDESLLPKCTHDCNDNIRITLDRLLAMEVHDGEPWFNGVAVDENTVCFLECTNSEGTTRKSVTTCADSGVSGTNFTWIDSPELLEEACPPEKGNKVLQAH